jgi:hypothetical protein
MLNIIKNTINRVFASGVDSDASAFITATGLSGTTQKSAITTLVKDLKSSGLWSKMKAVYPMVTDNYNQFYYSEDFSNANWYRINNTITTNSTTAPNGTLTADTFADNATNNIHQIAANYTLTGINGNNTASIYAKANTLNWICVTYFISGAYQKTFFDLQNGVVGTNASGNTATIENVGNGWYRCSITRNFNATGSFNVGFHTASADNVDSYAGSGQSLYIWGAQFQAGTPLAYQQIATTPSAFMASQMKYNLKDARDLDAAFRLTWSGGWTYSATGATPNGTNGYANTNLLGNTNVLKGDFGFGIYSRTNVNNNGAFGIDTSLHIYPRFTDTTTYYRLFNGGIGVNNNSSLGFIHGYNNSSFVSTSWYNSNKVNTYNSSTFNISSTNLLLGGNVPGAGGFDNRQLAFAFASQSLNDTEAQLLNQITEKYQVALSRGVQAAQSFYYNSAYSNEANTYLYSTQITGTTQVSAINTLINGLKANNLWTKMKAVYPFVTDKINLLSYTEDFTNAAWTQTNVSVSANSTTAPNSTLTADTLTEAASSTTHILKTTDIISFTTGITYTYSIYAKNTVGGRGLVQLAAYQIATGNTDAYCNFNLANGTIGANANCTYSIQDVGNGWYRCTITATSTKTYLDRYNVILIDNINASSFPSYLGDVSKSIYIWGAQFEIGALSTYQPVLGANNYATNVAAQMKFNLVNPQDTDAAFRLAFSGGWTYSTNGAQPNGTNGYADTKLVPSTSLSTSSAHLSFYSRTNSPSSGYFGYEVAIGHYALITQYQGNKFYPNLEAGGSYAAVYTSTNGLGHFIASRLNNTTVQGFKNGLKVVDSALASTLATSALLISSRGGGNYSDKQTAFASIGDGLTDAEALALYNLIQQFQTDLNRSVV